MAHTLPPWTSKYKLTEVFSGIDVNELAVRLGSPVNLDRRGNIVFIDDVEHALRKWEVSTTGDRGSCNVNANYSK